MDSSKEDMKRRVAHIKEEICESYTVHFAPGSRCITLKNCEEGNSVKEEECEGGLVCVKIEDSECDSFGLGIQNLETESVKDEAYSKNDLHLQECPVLPKETYLECTSGNDGPPLQLGLNPKYSEPGDEGNEECISMKEQQVQSSVCQAGTYVQESGSFHVSLSAQIASQSRSHKKQDNENLKDLASGSKSSILPSMQLDSLATVKLPMKEAFNTDQQVQSSKLVRFYVCQECGKSFKHMSSYSNHHRSHKGQKPYCCSECGKQLSDFSSLKNHKRIHTAFRVTQEFTLEKSHTAVLSVANNSPTRAVCRSTQEFTLVRNHIAVLNVVNNSQMQATSGTTKEFTLEKRLIPAKKKTIAEGAIKSRVKPYCCAECSKQFSSSSSFQRHIKIHTGEKPHCCSECGKRFLYSSSLKSHIRTHTGEKPYCCSNCGKQFSKSSNLRSHKQIHSGEKAYSCSECGKCFSHISHLQEHTHIHTRDKPYTSNMTDNSHTIALLSDVQELILEENHLNILNVVNDSVEHQDNREAYATQSSEKAPGERQKLVGKTEEEEPAGKEGVLWNMAATNNNVMKKRVTHIKEEVCEWPPAHGKLEGHCMKLTDNEEKMSAVKEEASEEALTDIKTEACKCVPVDLGVLNPEAFNDLNPDASLKKDFSLPACPALPGEMHLGEQRVPQQSVRFIPKFENLSTDEKKMESKEQSLQDNGSENLKPPSFQYRIQAVVKLTRINCINTQVQNKNHSSWHVCQKCGKSFKCKANLTSYAKEQTYCSECIQQFCTSTSLQIHERIQNGEKPYCCSQCSKRFSKLRYLQIHAGIHAGDKPYCCSECGKQFSHNTSLKNHKKTHTGERPYCCSECGKQFQRVRSLECHTRIHTGEKPYCCPECGKRFSRCSDFGKHTRVHTGEKPYCCLECGKRFSQLHSLRSHTRIHTGDKPYSCSECGKQFSHRDTLKNHKRTHTGDRPYSCSECVKRFRHRGSLKNHERTHTGDKPYCCSDCGKQFSQSTSFEIHRRIHTGEKPYFCSECGKQFYYSSGLQKHRRIHTGEKPHCCTECGKRFLQLFSLQRHTKLHTGRKKE
ncbi:zinc finger protein 184-like [Erpetoichthys calabaricus]|nr:zinc finger protein 184-like [Erpetoichthys calabaricus]